MRKILRYSAYGFISLCVLAIIVVGALLLFVHSEAFSGWVSRHASDALGREVRIENAIEIKPGRTTRITVHNFAIANTEGAEEPHMIKAKRLEFTWRPLALLKGDLVLPEVIAIAPVVELMRDKEGRGNWEFTQNPAGSAISAAAPEERGEIPIIGRLVIEDGKLRYRDEKGGIDVQLEAASLKGKAEESDLIRLHGGGTYNQKPFRLDFTGGSVLQLRESDKPYPVKADIRAGDTRAKLDGTVQDIVKMEGLDIAMKISGADAKELYDLTGIVFPPTPPYTLNGQLSKGEQEWRFTGFKGRMGESDLSGDLIWDVSDEKRPMLRGNFHSTNLDMNDLGGLIGATPGDVASGAATDEQMEAARKAEESPYLIPETSLDISRLKAMDADVVFNAERIKTPNLLDKFHMHLTLEQGVLSLTPIRFEMADGKIEGTLSINGRENPPHTQVNATLSRLSLRKLFAPAMEKLGQKNVSQGFLGGKVKLSGTGLSMHDMLGTSNGMVGLGMEGGQLSNLIMEILGIDLFEALGFLATGDDPTRVRCVIADFVAKDGMLSTQRFVIDTEDTNIIGEGELAFKTEEIRFQLTPYPKDPSILAATSPVRVQGRLKDLSVRPALVNIGARGGAAAILAALLPPLAVLAFIEPGLGKDSDCAAFVQELQQKTGGAIPVNRPRQ